MDFNTDAVWLTAAQVARRYSISAMALWRWLHDSQLGFPAPIKVRDRNYFRLADIEAWEREAASAAASKRGKRNAQSPAA